MTPEQEIAWVEDWNDHVASALEGWSESTLRPESILAIDKERKETQAALCRVRDKINDVREAVDSCYEDGPPSRLKERDELVPLVRIIHQTVITPEDSTSPCRHAEENARLREAVDHVKECNCNLRCSKAEAIMGWFPTDRDHTQCEEGK